MSDKKQKSMLFIDSTNFKFLIAVGLNPMKYEFNPTD